MLRELQNKLQPKKVDTNLEVDKTLEITIK